MDELWVDIKGFPLYRISSLGRVKSLSRPERISEKIIGGWIKYSKTNKPVCRNVSLRRDNHTHEFRLHILVLENFVGKCPDGMECCHNDGNPLNNRIENLRWDTHKNNIQDCILHGKKVNPPTFYGVGHPRSKFNEDDIAYIRSHKKKRGLFVSLAELYNVAPITISRIYNQESYL